jgi:very-short-patch-repair endonuclease
MANADGAKRSKAARAPADGGHKHAPRAYVTRVLSLAEVWGFMHGGAGPEAVVAMVAAHQLGLITTPQLHVAGVGRGVVQRRLANGMLHRRYRGVYLVGHPILLPGAAELAGVLACGRQTFVSHRSAARLWGLVQTSGGDVEVTVAGRECRSRHGLLVHSVEALAAADQAERRGIPVTAPARALIDFASTTGRDDAERAIAEGFALKLVTEQQLRGAADRAPNRAGVARVKAILGQPGGPSRTRSDGERAMLRLIRAAHLPPPRTNYHVAGYSADFCWPDERLIVELDGYDFHSNRAAFERDHRRDIAHRDAGYEVLRFTGRQLEEAPVYVATVIARALDRRGRSRPRG